MIGAAGRMAVAPMGVALVRLLSVSLQACVALAGLVAAGTGPMVNAVEPVPTTTTISMSPTTPGIWKPVTLTATVTPVHPGMTQAEFRLDGYTIAFAPVDETGTAVYVHQEGFSSGPHTIRAGYAGDAVYGQSLTDPVPFTVVDPRTPVTVTLTTDPNPVLRGDPFAMHATVTPNPGNGTVKFFNLGYQFWPPVEIGPDGTADKTGSLTTSGPAPIRACYGGNETYQEVCSEPVEQVATTIPTTTSVMITPAVVYPDEPFTVAIDVTPLPPAGTQVYVSGAPQLFLDASGHAEFTQLPGGHTFGMGEHDVTAYFPGAMQLAPSFSDPVRLTVRQDPSTLRLEMTQGAEVGEEVTFRATVTPAPEVDDRGVGLYLTGPAGTGLVWPLGIPLGRNGTGELTVDTDHWPAGEYSVEASYSGTRIVTTTIVSPWALSDIDPPTGHVVVATSEPVVLSSRVVVGAPSDDGVGSGVDTIAVSNDGKAWTERTAYFESFFWDLVPGDGPRTVHVRWRDQAGNWSEIARASVVVDRHYAGVGVPATRMPSDAPVARRSLPLRIVFAAPAPGTVVAGYRIEERVDGGAWRPVDKLAPTTSTLRAVASGHSYRYRVRAVDRGGSVGPWVAQPGAAAVSAIQQSSPGVSYRGRWSTRSVASAWGGSLRRTTAAGATASLQTSGRGVAWVARRGPTLGSATVRVDGVRVATVSLYARTWTAPQVVWSRTWAASRSRTIVVRASGSAGHPGVEVDGFYAIR